MSATIRLRRSSLRTQIAVVFGLLIVVLGLLLSTLLSDMLRQHLQKQAGISLELAARNAAKMLANGLQERSREVQVLAQSTPLWAQGLQSPLVQQVMARSQATHPHSLWIGVADLNGVVRAATGNLLVGQNVKERPWFSAGLRGVHVGDVHPAKLLAKLLPPSASGEPQRFVDFSAPIVRNGQTVGVLAIHGSWDWTREVIESLLPPWAAERQLQLFIFDHQGQVIYAPPGPSRGLPRQWPAPASAARWCQRQRRGLARRKKLPHGHSAFERARPGQQPGLAHRGARTAGAGLC